MYLYEILLFLRGKTGKNGLVTSQSLVTDSDTFYSLRQA
jgi:hypothetical protein